MDKTAKTSFNPYLTNVFSHPYQLDESTFIFRGVRSDFFLFISFFDEISLCKQIVVVVVKSGSCYVMPGQTDLIQGSTTISINKSQEQRRSADKE